MCTVVLVKNDPRDVVRLIRLSQATMNKTRQNLVWATAYNVTAVPMAVGDDGNAVLSRFGTHNVRQLPVVEGRRLTGMVRRADVISYLQLRAELGA